MNTSTSIQSCVRTCDTASSIYSSTENTCNCNAGYRTLQLYGSFFRCNATCDYTSMTYNSTNNLCSCKTGFSNLQNFANETKYCIKTCNTSNSFLDLNLNTCTCKTGYSYSSFSQYPCVIDCDDKSTTRDIS